MSAKEIPNGAQPGDPQPSLDVLFRRYFAYRIRGLLLPQREMTISAAPAELEIHLTASIDELCKEADEERAHAVGMLTGSFAAEKLPAWPNHLAEIIARRRSERSERFGTGPFMVFIHTGSVLILTTRPTFEREIGETVLCFDAVDQDALRERSRQSITFAAVTLALALPSVSGFDEVLDEVVFYRPDGKKLYSFSAQFGSLRVRPDTRVGLVELERAAAAVNAAVGADSMRRVAQLLLRSLLQDDDRLRAFLAAWATLEILVNSAFREYEEHFFQDVAGGRPGPHRDYLTAVRKVMRDKHRLADKFRVISGTLSPDSAETDLDTFQRSKKIRDDLAHGDEVADSSLPVEPVLSLARKYLRLHLDPRRRAAG